MKRSTSPLVGSILTGGLALSVCGGCASDQPADQHSGTVVRDSSGVRVVENGQLAAGPWRVDPEPYFTVGWGADDPDFTWLQSGRILSDGGVLVGDFGSGVLYRLASDGSIVGRWGGKGQGPGEYQGFDAILVDGDSIVVSDGRLLRLTVLSLTGEVLATHRKAGSFLHDASSFLPDGRLLLVPGNGYGGLPETRPEWVFESQPIMASDIQHESADTLAELPHLRRWYGTRGGSPGPILVQGRAGGFQKGFAWARADRPEVRWFDHDGKLRQVSRWAEEAAPLTAETRTAFTDMLVPLLRASGVDGPMLQARLTELEEGFDLHDAPMPYWGSFRVDPAGNAWLSEYAFIGQFPDRWRVIAHDGTAIGWIDLPDVVSVLDITDDRILAVRFDEFDVPALVMFELGKG